MIGHGFKIPDEILSQFEGLTDPLLEVIIHWFRGKGDTLPSWDAVISILRDPVKEVELAGKIQRLYCEEGPVRSEKKADLGEHKLQTNYSCIVRQN